MWRVFDPWIYTARLAWLVVRWLWPGAFLVSFALLWMGVGIIVALVLTGQRVEVVW